jgi:hypothetical protein
MYMLPDRRLLPCRIRVIADATAVRESVQLLRLLLCQSGAEEATVSVLS